MQVLKTKESRSGFISKNSQVNVNNKVYYFWNF